MCYSTRMTAPAWLLELWTAIQPRVVEALVLLLTTAVGVAVAWLRRQQLKWEVAKQATQEAEELGQQHGLDGPAKLTIAMRKVKNAAPLLAKMGPQESKRMINRALRESAPGVPLSDSSVDRTAPTLPPKE
jgi:hypothetical protein